MMRQTKGAVRLGPATVSDAKGAGSSPTESDAERRLEERLEEQMWLVHQMVASIEIMLVDGYFVKIWINPETEVWIAECPTVKAVVEGPSRDEVAAAIPEAMADMLDVLAEMGKALPPKDVH